MPAPKGNQNAAKPDTGEKDYAHIRALKSHIQSWNEIAVSKGLSLTKWATKTLNAEVKRVRSREKR